MWTRRELKEKAKANLKGRYWAAFGACMVVSVITGIPSSVSGSGNNVLVNLDFNNPALFLMVLMSVMVMGLISLAVSIFVTNHFQVGLASYFLNNRIANGNINDVFYAFKGGRYLNILAVTFMRDLFIILWTLLFIVPGIIKGYQYYLVKYIVAENPDINYREALAQSKFMMEGQKMKAFVLELSFIGWYLLGLLACCIGIIFVVPYQNATVAELYCELKQQTISPFDKNNFDNSANINY